MQKIVGMFYKKSTTKVRHLGEVKIDIHSQEQEFYLYLYNPSTQKHVRRWIKIEDIFDDNINLVEKYLS